jgi:hypothetical protein
MDGSKPPMGQSAVLVSRNPRGRPGAISCNGWRSAAPPRDLDKIGSNRHPCAPKAPRRFLAAPRRPRSGRATPAIIGTNQLSTRPTAPGARHVDGGSRQPPASTRAAKPWRLRRTRTLSLDRGGSVRRRPQMQRLPRPQPPCWCVDASHCRRARHRSPQPMPSNADRPHLRRCTGFDAYVAGRQPRQGHRAPTARMPGTESPRTVENCRRSPAPRIGGRQAAQAPA